MMKKAMMKKSIEEISNKLNLDNMICTKTKEEISEKILACLDADNFTDDWYGSSDAGEDLYAINFSEYSTKNTLCEFVNWLFS